MDGQNPAGLPRSCPLCLSSTRIDLLTFRVPSLIYVLTKVAKDPLNVRTLLFCSAKRPPSGYFHGAHGSKFRARTGSCPSWRSRATPTGPSAGTWRRSGSCSACARPRRSASGPRTSATTSPSEWCPFPAYFFWLGGVPF